jgi:hypothetical protein
MKEPLAIAYARALAVWSQWLRHWRHTGDPRAFRTALACKQIALEKKAALKANPSALLAAREERAARSELGLHRILLELKRQERELVHIAVLLPRETINVGRRRVPPLPAPFSDEEAA